MLCDVVFYTASSKDFQSLLEVVWNNIASVETTLQERFATKSIKEITTNILIRAIRI